MKRIRLGMLFLSILFVISGCGSAATSTGPSNAPTATGQSGGTKGSVDIWASLPMQGSAKSRSDMVNKAIALAIEQAGGAVDGWSITYTPQDDSTADAGTWTAEKELDDATRAIADPNLVAYIGTNNSGAAEISIPILCKAGIPMIDYGASYAGLTKPGKGTADEPDVYYKDCKDGIKNFFRVVPADDVQGKAGADWAKDLGATSVYIIDDASMYGVGLTAVFESSAKQDGLTILGHDEAPGTLTDYKALAAKINATNPDLVYYGGTVDSNAGQVWRDLRAAMPNVKLMGPEGIGTQGWLDAAGSAAEGTYLTFPGIPSDQYTGKAAEFRDAFEAKYNVTSLDPLAIYGYESASIALFTMDQAIKNGATTPAEMRVQMLTALHGVKDYTGALGTWSFDSNDDATVGAFSGDQVVNGQFVFVKSLAS